MNEIQIGIKEFILKNNNYNLLFDICMHVIASTSTLYLVLFF